MEETEIKGNIEDDEIPEVKESRVVLGDIWKLGEHRIMCGDSTSVDDVDKLMNGKKLVIILGLGKKTQMLLCQRKNKNIKNECIK